MFEKPNRKDAPTNSKIKKPFLFFGVHTGLFSTQKISKGVLFYRNSELRGRGRTLPEMPAS